MKRFKNFWVRKVDICIVFSYARIISVASVVNALTSAEIEPLPSELLIVESSKPTNCDAGTTPPLTTSPQTLVSQVIVVSSSALTRTKKVPVIASPEASVNESV
jgi:hypothetical protein